MNACSITILGIISLCGGAAAAAALPRLVATHGVSDPICNETQDVLERTDPRGFGDGSWPRSFGVQDWARGSWSTITTSGMREDVPYKYFRGDLDGDGSEEIAVVTTGMIRSVNFDWLYLMDVRSFQSAQRDGDMQLALDQAQKLNPNNLVVFSNDAEAIPVELGLWSREGQIYLLLKEYNFAKAGQRVANAFVVASLANAVFSGDDKRLRPRLVCRFIQ